MTKNDTDYIDDESSEFYSPSLARCSYFVGNPDERLSAQTNHNLRLRVAPASDLAAHLHGIDEAIDQEPIGVECPYCMRYYKGPKSDKCDTCGGGLYDRVGARFEETEQKPARQEVVEELWDEWTRTGPETLPNKKSGWSNDLFRWLFVVIIIVTCLLWLRDVANFFFIVNRRGNHRLCRWRSAISFLDILKHLCYNSHIMRVVAKIKLTPDNKQRYTLGSTLEIANHACNYISEQVWRTKTFKQFDIHRLVYKDIRDKFPLSAQMAVRQIAKVADAYKVDRKIKRTFSLQGAISYDDRILSWKLDKQIVSLWTIEGRLKIPFVTGQRQLELLQNRRGESDLCLIGGEFYLFATCDVEEPPIEEVSEFLGVDLGIKAIAADSDGEIYSGSHLNNIRGRYSGLRSKLQSKGTKSARKLLKKRNRKEKNFANNTNHVISKHIVSKAKDTGRGIALEDLSGIRERITVKKGQRRVHQSWAFYDLVQKIKYKAALAGVLVVLINPKNTSRECAVCGYVDKRNRPDQETFLCKNCSHSNNADVNAARVISRRPVINRANVGDLLLAV